MLTAQAPALLAVAAIVFATRGYPPHPGSQPCHYVSKTAQLTRCASDFSHSAGLSSIHYGKSTVAGELANRRVHHAIRSTHLAKPEPSKLDLPSSPPSEDLVSSLFRVICWLTDKLSRAPLRLFSRLCSCWAHCGALVKDPSTRRYPTA